MPDLTRRPGFNVIGHVSGNLGLGVMARNLIRTLVKLGYPVAALDVDPGSGRGKHDLSFEQVTVARPEDLTQGINLFALPAPSLQSLLPNLSELVVDPSRINVALPMWELSVLPPGWEVILEFFDVLVAGSPFIRATLDCSLSNVFTILGHQPVFMPDGIEADRGRIGLPEDEVVFLAAFEPHSDPHRKNPEGAVRAFLNAFSGDAGAHLFVKANNAFVAGEEHPSLARLRAIADGCPAVSFLTDDYSYAQVLSLLASVDVVVSLHRAEGLGLVPFEAMMLGKPVIATAWSGNMGFMNHINACLVDYDLVPVQGSGGQYEKMLAGVPATWAEPNIATAAAWMRRLAQDRDLRRRRGQQAKSSIQAFDKDARRGVFLDELLAVYYNRDLLCSRFADRQARLDRIRLLPRAPAPRSEHGVQVSVPRSWLSAEQDRKRDALRLKAQVLRRLDAIQTSASWQLSGSLRALESRWPRILRGIAAIPKLAWWTLCLRLPQRLRVRRLASELLDTGLFDRPWYVENNADIILDGQNPVLHWLVIGWTEGRDPNPLFDTDWYLEQNPDLAEAGTNPLEHYLARGAAEGRDPNPLFNTKWYLAQNPGVAEAGANPLAHYLRSGAAEGRDPNPLFDTERYLKQNPDVTATGINPLYHYLLRGQREVRRTRRYAAPRATFPKAMAEGWTAELRADPAFARLHEAMPLVSIVMPTRNRAHMLPQTIDSVLAQRWQRWELFVVDDHSDDGTADLIARRYADSRIRLLTNEGRGICDARNRGLAESRGEFIAYLDSDNHWTPEYLELMLADLERSGADSAYAVLMRITGPPGQPGTKVNYRYEAFDFEQLKFENYIDINVFMHRRRLYDDLGGFDPALKRMVDWDLILRYTRKRAPAQAMFIGVHYDASPAEDRITNTERLSYLNVVRNKHCIDWERQLVDAGTRGPGLVSIVTCVYGRIDLTDACLHSLFRHEAGERFELILVDNASDPETARRLREWEAAREEIRLIRNPENLNFALGNNVGFAASRGARVVFLNNDTEVTPEWLRALVRPLADPAVLGVQPRLLYPDGTIQAIGIVFPDHSAMGYPIYAGQPATLAAAQRPRDFAAVTAACVAFRAEDFARMRGFDPIYVNGQEDIDLCLRLGGDRPVFRYAPDSLLFHHESQSPGRRKNIESNRRIFHERWQGKVRADDRRYYAQDGIEVIDHAPDNPAWVDAGYAVWRPKLVAPRGDGGDSLHERLRERVVAIKVPCPRPAMKDHWGDYHLAVALVAAFARRGVIARIDFLESWDRASTDRDINLVLRGLSRFMPTRGAIDLLWLISHPDKIESGEFDDYDQVFVASNVWAEKLAATESVPVEPLLQCTDICRFRPEAFDPALRTRALFVANSRKVLRRVVRDAIEQNVELDIYGEKWEGLAPDAWVRATKVDNIDLPGYYASAELVLNDHWDRMRDNGFVSNRVFDVLACAAPLVTDSVAGLPVELEAGCHFFDRDRPLREVVEAARCEPGQPTPEALALARLVRERHSFDARAARILEVIAGLVDHSSTGALKT